MSIHYEELKKLSISDLVALENYVKKRRDTVNDLLSQSVEGSETYQNNYNSLVACNLIESTVQNEIADRAFSIYSEYRIKY